MNLLPAKEFTDPQGYLNLHAYVPIEFVPSDLGPKMYNAYESLDAYGSTNLHMDMADAVNIMIAAEKTTTAEYGAVWDIYSRAATPHIRSLLNTHAERKELDITDGIHDQAFYLNRHMREELGRHTINNEPVRSWRIFQNPGDAVIIPAGCAHQVLNLQPSVKCAMDFVAPASVLECWRLTKEFRMLSSDHLRREDILQLRVIFACVFDKILSSQAKHSVLAFT